jgi:4'-phosphopantetheinyl transferase
MLSEGETARLAQLTVEKRRRDWLLGRWTAKQLVQSYLEREIGVSLPLHAIEIVNDADGAPRAIYDLRFTIDDFTTRAIVNRQSSIVNISISHSYEHAFCAVCGTPGLSLGADMERVEARPQGFAADYFTRDEMNTLANTPTAQYDTLVTAIWSAKEAALKAVRRGLTVDTRQVSCSITPPTSQEWNSFSLTLAPELTPAPVAAYAPSSPADSWPDAAAASTSSGWWRTWGEFVVTMVVVKEA